MSKYLILKMRKVSLQSSSRLLSIVLLSFFVLLSVGPQMMTFAYSFDNNYIDEESIKNNIIQDKKIIRKRDTLKDPQILHRVISAPPSIISSSDVDGGGGMYSNSYSVDSTAPNYLCSQVTMGRSTSLTTYLHYTLDLEYLPGSCKSIGYTRKRGLRPHRGGEGVLIEDFAPDHEGVVQKYKRQEYHKMLDEKKFRADIQRREDYLYDFDADSDSIYNPRSRGNRRQDFYRKSSTQNLPHQANIDLTGEIEIDKTTLIDSETNLFSEKEKEVDSSEFSNLMQRMRSQDKASDKDPRTVMSEIYLN